MIDVKVVRDFFSYDPQSGILTWKVNRGSNHMTGEMAGYTDSHGYVKIRVHNKSYSAHRIAWVWMTGENPPCEIDHINRNPSDNRWINLRLATRSQNAANRRPFGNRTVKGVYRNKRGKPYCAKIRVDGLLKHLGSFDSFRNAHEVFQWEHAKIYREFSCA